MPRGLNLQPTRLVAAARAARAAAELAAHAVDARHARATATRITQADVEQADCRARRARSGASLACKSHEPRCRYRPAELNSGVVELWSLLPPVSSLLEPLSATGVLASLPLLLAVAIDTRIMLLVVLGKRRRLPTSSSKPM